MPGLRPPLALRAKIRFSLLTFNEVDSVEFVAVHHDLDGRSLQVKQDAGCSTIACSIQQACAQ